MAKQMILKIKWVILGKNQIFFGKNIPARAKRQQKKRLSPLDLVILFW